MRRGPRGRPVASQAASLTASLPNGCAGSADLMPSSSGILSGRPSAAAHEAAQLFCSSATVAACSGRAMRLVVSSGSLAQVVQLGQVPVGTAVAVRIVDVFVAVGADAADVGRVGKLLFVVVFVVPARAPAGWRRPGRASSRTRRGVLASGGDAADVEDRRGEVEREDLLVDDCGRPSLTLGWTAGATSAHG